MNKFYILFAAVMAASTISSAAIIPEQIMTLHGVDVRNKDGKYQLVVGKENILLEERHYKLMKVEGVKKHTIAEGHAVFMGPNAKGDLESLWRNERAELKFGKLTGNNKPKQIVVLKLKDLNRTFAFELFHDL